MKSMKLIFIAIVAMFIFSACDELIKKDVDVPITFTVSSSMAIPEDSDPNATNAFGNSGSYDILSHPDVANVIGTPDKIKKIKITKIVYEFNNFSGNVDATVVNGTIDLITILNPDKYDGSGLSHFAFSTVNVAKATLLKEQFVLNGNFDGVSDVLSQEAIFFYRIGGTSTHNPAIFNIVLTVSATVTVEASIDFQGNYN